MNCVHLFANITHRLVLHQQSTTSVPLHTRPIDAPDWARWFKTTTQVQGREFFCAAGGMTRIVWSDDSLDLNPIQHKAELGRKVWEDL